MTVVGSDGVEATVEEMDAIWGAVEAAVKDRFQKEGMVWDVIWAEKLAKRRAQGKSDHRLGPVLDDLRAFRNEFRKR